jgi:ribosomal protein L7/L12
MMGTFALAVVDVLLAVCLGIALFVIQARQQDHAARLARLERKLDLLLRYWEIQDSTAVPVVPAVTAPAPPTRTNDDLARELAALVARGQKIEAIKRYREYTGTGLREAKEAVEAIERQVG